MRIEIITFSENSGKSIFLSEKKIVPTRYYWSFDFLKAKSSPFYVLSNFIKTWIWKTKICSCFKIIHILFYFDPSHFYGFPPISHPARISSSIFSYHSTLHPLIMMVRIWWVYLFVCFFPSPSNSSHPVHTTNFHKNWKINNFDLRTYFRSFWRKASFSPEGTFF